MPNFSNGEYIAFTSHYLTYPDRQLMAVFSRLRLKPNYPNASPQHVQTPEDY